MLTWFHSTRDNEREGYVAVFTDNDVVLWGFTRWEGIDTISAALVRSEL